MNCIAKNPTMMWKEYKVLNLIFPNILAGICFFLARLLFGSSPHLSLAKNCFFFENVQETCSHYDFVNDFIRNWDQALGVHFASWRFCISWASSYFHTISTFSFTSHATFQHQAINTQTPSSQIFCLEILIQHDRAGSRRVLGEYLRESELLN